MALRRRACSDQVTRGRMRKAIQFLEATRAFEDEGGEARHGDAYVTLCVHAGIAAADAICCRALGQHAQTETHAQSVELLRSVTPNGTSLARDLASLLAMKARAEYGYDQVSGEQVRRAKRTAARLVAEAQRRV